MTHAVSPVGTGGTGDVAVTRTVHGRGQQRIVVSGADAEAVRVHAMDIWIGADQWLRQFNAPTVRANATGGFDALVVIDDAE